MSTAGHARARRSYGNSIATGDIDTVLVAFPDLQGRLVGKRVTGHYWVDQMQGGGEPHHACNYLLAVDVDMTPLPGYQFANWEQGYGDVAVQPDLATMRRIPWLEKTALVLCDLVDEDDAATPVEVSPRRILQRQVERAGRRRVHGASSRPSSSSSCSASRSTRRAAKDYAEPHAALARDRGLPHPPDDARRVPHPRRSATAWTARACRSSSRRAKPAAASTRSTSCTPTPVEMADRHVIYKNGAKEIAVAARPVDHVHGEVLDRRGRLVVPHPLEPVGRRRRRSR